MKMRVCLLGSLVLSLSVTFGLSGSADAESRAARVRTARVASQRVRLSRARDAVYVGRRSVWSGRSPREHVISAVRWSRHRDAVAFATRGRFGATTLIVVLVGRGVDGHVMRFPVPARSRPRAGKTHVMWLGRRRVGLGASSVRPNLVASWRLRQ